MVGFQTPYGGDLGSLAGSSNSGTPYAGSAVAGSAQGGTPNMKVPGAYGGM